MYVTYVCVNTSETAKKSLPGSHEAYDLSCWATEKQEGAGIVRGHLIQSLMRGRSFPIL